MRADPFPMDVVMGGMIGGAVMISASDAEMGTDAEIAAAVREHIAAAKSCYALSLCRFREPVEDHYGIDGPEGPPIKVEKDAHVIARIRSEYEFLLDYEGTDARIDAALARYDEWLTYQRAHPKALRAMRGRIAMRYEEIHSILSKRDGEECQACGAKDHLEIDHDVPVSRGGTNDLRNLQLLCAPCNRSKGAKTMDEWQS